MSYLFDAFNEKIEGSFTSTYAVDGSNAITLACHAYVADWTSANQGLVSLEEAAGVTDPSVYLFGQTNDTFFARAYDAGGDNTASYASAADAYANQWVLIVGVFSSNTNRDVYVAGSSNTGDGGSTSRTLDAGDVVRLGNWAGSSGHLAGSLAEVGIWNKALSTSEIDELVTKKPSAVAAANLIGYWPLDTDRDTEGTVLNEGTDAGGTLTITNATYNDGSHPSLSDPSTTIEIPTGPLR